MSTDEKYVSEMSIVRVENSPEFKVSFLAIILGKNHLYVMLKTSTMIARE